MVSLILKMKICGQEIVLMPMRMRWSRAEAKVSRKNDGGMIGCSCTSPPMMIMDEGTVDYSCYIKKHISYSFKIWWWSFWRQVDLSTRWCKPTPTSFNTRMSDNNSEVIWILFMLITTVSKIDDLMIGPIIIFLCTHLSHWLTISSYHLIFSLYSSCSYTRLCFM